MRLVQHVGFPVHDRPALVLAQAVISSVNLAFVRSILKRIIDLSVAVVCLVVFSPVLAAAAVAIRITSGAPVLFRQTRPGLHGRPFTIFKFRTMANVRDSNGDLLPDAQRLTRVGRFLRASSLDEFPQLINVIRGELSLVGPRPLLTEYLDRYTPEQARRHEVLPGITGWAQVNGRNAVEWEERLRLDVWYVDHWSLWLDFRILFSTMKSVLRRRGISYPGHETMPPFRGSR
jgi:sugar transferase EpsL